MDGEQFGAFVQKLERFARQQPKAYKLRVGLLATLGYAYIFLILTVLLGTLVAIALLIASSKTISGGAIKLIILLAAFIVFVLQSLWVTFPPPVGLELSRQQVPHLFALIDRLTSTLQAPQFHRVLLTDDFNACVVQVPRLGILGWQQNYLILGLPLMQALTPGQFRAVLAHELGHLSGNHSRFAGWIYRIRKTWLQLFEKSQQTRNHAFAILFEPFFHWYTPFFSAYSFVLARIDEYEADRCAAEIAGAQNIAAALVNIEVKSRFLQSQFWSDVNRQMDDRAEPPESIFNNMSVAIHQDVKLDDAQKWLAQALATTTDTADTHPCLTERLAALGYGDRPEQFLSSIPPQDRAAEEFLSNNLQQLTEHFNLAWQEQVATPWRQRYAYAQAAQKNLQALEEKASQQSLTSEEAWNRANWTAEFRETEAAIALFREFLSTHSQHAAANYALGKILLQQHDPTGIDYLERAMMADADNIMSACELIYSFAIQKGDKQTAEVYEQRAGQHYRLLLQAREERSQLGVGDRFEPHDLSVEAIAQLQQQLSSHNQIAKAYLVRKIVQYLPEKPCYILGIEREFHKLKPETTDERELVQQLIREISAEILVLILDDRTRDLEKKIGRIEGAAIYTKPKHTKQITSK